MPDQDLLPHKGAELPFSLGYSALYFCITPNANMLASVSNIIKISRKYVLFDD
jgi:hypothetical protein